MLERYRTLGAMLALREFTVADLARYSGVKESTVRTILARESQYVQRHGVRPSSKPGGQPLTYSLKSDAEPQLVEVLRELEAVGARGPASHESATESAIPVPTALVAAEDVLLRQIPSARMAAERDQLLELAATDFETVLQATPDIAEREVATHLKVVDLLLRLSRTEQQIPSSGMLAYMAQESPRLVGVPFAGRGAEEKLYELSIDLQHLLAEMPELQDKSLLPDLFKRVGTSPFAPALLAPPGRQRVTLSPYVFLFDTGGPETASVIEFVREVLRNQKISFSRLPLTSLGVGPEEELQAIEPHGILDPSPFTAILMTVQVGHENGRMALARVGEMCGSLRKFVVVGDRYDNELSNQVTALQARYLSFQGLRSTGLLGALSAAMTEPPSGPLGEHELAQELLREHSYWSGGDLPALLESHNKFRPHQTAGSSGYADLDWLNSLDPDRLTRVDLDYLKGVDLDRLKALSVAGAQLGPDHPNTLAIRGSLAHLLGEVGQVHEAAVQYRQLLEDQARVLGPDHPATLSTRNDLAHSLGREGRVQDAITEFKRLLEDRIRVLGPDHPATLSTRNELAHSLGRAGRVQEAITEFRRLLEDQVRLLGSDHPDSLNTRNDLAHSLGRAGRLKEALTEFTELQEEQVRVLGPDHPDTLNTGNYLAYLRETL